jgi:FKBP-type peptidyl-prolyl cis-trans isomerase 2
MDVPLHGRSRRRRNTNAVFISVDIPARPRKEFGISQKEKMKTSIIILATLATLSALGTLHPADITGKWKSEFETQIGQLKYTYELKADGTKLAGKAIRTLEGQTTETEVKEGKVSGTDVSFVEMLKFQDQEIRIDYTGKLAGDEIKFTRKVGDFATTEIVAKREKEAAPAVAGKWQAEFDTQIGKQKYIYEFKADGGKLTGKAVGDIAGAKTDTEIKEGKINGAEISFVEMVKFQDQDIRVEYKGRLAGDEIKFTRTVAETIKEELVAKRIKDPSAK